MIYIIFFIGLLIGLGIGIWAGYSYVIFNIKDLSPDTGTYQCPTCQRPEYAGQA